MGEQGHQAGALLGILQRPGAGEEERPMEGDRLDSLRLLSPVRPGRWLCLILQSRKIHRDQRGHSQVSIDASFTHI